MVDACGVGQNLQNFLDRIHKIYRILLGLILQGTSGNLLSYKKWLEIFSDQGGRKAC